MSTKSDQAQDTDGGVIRLESGETKNGEGRTLPYAAIPELADLIRDRQAERDRLKENGVICPLVFHRRGKRIKSLYGSWRTACKLAGVPGRLIHDFRRTRARELVRAGVAEVVAMRWLGHQTASIFRRYAITTEADLADAASKLAGTKQGQSEDRERAAS